MFVKYFFVSVYKSFLETLSYIIDTDEMSAMSSHKAKIMYLLRKFEAIQKMQQNN